MANWRGISMARYLFEFIELLSFIGDGTPEYPGGNFSMHCWIEAPDKESAVEWGYVLLGDYCKARYAHSADGHRHDGSPIRQGDLVEDPELLATAKEWNVPSCRAGEIPEWREPWRISNVG
jgi:hypothetical protein